MQFLFISPVDLNVSINWIIDLLKSSEVITDSDVISSTHKLINGRTGVLLDYTAMFERNIVYEGEDNTLYILLTSDYSSIFKITKEEYLIL